uniref:Uncharacterized protein n=1 Tax=viral metagenome TaxID=1070528 RepID=A0A6C0CHD5_9ZZZZ
MSLPPFTNIDLNELDYVVKRTTYAVVKTDGAGGELSGPNEKIATSGIVGQENVWIQTSGLTGGTSIALQNNVAQHAAVVANNNDSSYAYSFIEYNSVHDVGTSQDTGGALRAIAWQPANGPVTNWISPSYHSSFTPDFYVGPHSALPTVNPSTHNIKTTDNAVPPNTIYFKLASTHDNPFIFDYKTGILTFLGDPAQVNPSAYNLTQYSSPFDGNYTLVYSIYVRGYVYTGTTLATANFGSGNGSPGPTGPTGSSQTLQLVKNVGNFAYISGVTGTASYNQGTGNITLDTLKVFGNSSLYDIAVDLYQGSTLAYHNKYTNIVSGPTGIIDNAAGRGFDIKVGGNAISFSASGVTTGGYTGAVIVSTISAGGTGITGNVDGFQQVALIPNIQIAAQDIMGPPMVTYSTGNTGSGGSIAIGTSTTVTYSGYKYYTSGTTVVVPAHTLGFNNIYNTYDPGNYSSNQAVFFTGSATPLRYSDLVYYGGGSYNTFTTANVGQNLTYYNNSAVSITLTSIAEVQLNDIVNFLGAHLAGYYNLFPRNVINSSENQLIAWLASGSVPNTITSNGSIYSYTRSSVSGVTRMSVKSSVSDATKPNLSTEIQAADITTVSNTLDPCLYPLDPDVPYYADNTVGGALGSYLQPAGSVAFSSGTKQFLLRIDTTGSVTDFSITFGGYTTGIVPGFTDSSITVNWVDHAGNASGWASAYYPNSSSSPLGCQYAASGSTTTNGVTIYKYYFKIPDSAASGYYNGNSGSGSIYVNIQFTGVIYPRTITIGAAS